MNFFDSSLVVFTLFVIGVMALLFACALLTSRYWPGFWKFFFKSDQPSIDLLTSLLAASPYHWVVWMRSKEIFLYDQETRKLLDLPLPGQTSLENISQCFSPPDSITFKNSLQNFTEDTTSPEITLSLARAGQVSLLISPTNNKDCTILWIRKSTSPSQNTPQSAPTDSKSQLASLPLPIWKRSQDRQITDGNLHFQKLISADPALSDFLTQSAPTTRSIQRKVLIGDQPHEFLINEVILEDGSSSIGYAIDLTDTNLAQKNLENNASAFRALLDQLPLGIAIYNHKQKLMFSNVAYCQMFHLDTKWLSSQPELSEMLDHLHHRHLLTEQADFPSYKQQWLSMFNSFASPKQELIHLPDERTLRMLAAPFGQGGLFFAFENITDQLVLARKANTQVTLNQEILDQLQEGAAVFASDNRLKLANPAFAKLWNLPSEALTAGRHISELMDDIKNYFCYGQNWKRYKQHLIEGLTDRKAKKGELTRKDGRVFSFSYVPLPDGTHLLSYADITDSKKIRQAMIDSSKAFDKAEAIKSDFLANMSGNLKAPLDTVIGFSEILLNQYFGSLNSQQLAYCKAIFKASSTLLDSIKAMIDLSAIRSGKMTLSFQPVDLNQLLNSVISIVRNNTENSKIQITSSFTSHVQSFIADERRLKQAFLGLIYNAIQATPLGGSINVGVRTSHNNIFISIADTGVGIAAGEQPLIFNQFERTETSRQRYAGTGIGLSLIKGIIEMHQGEVTVTSTPRAGTTVTCRLPLSLQQSAQKHLPKIA
ncbi:MAG: PAS-domain containing protein [Pseudomonadota bacterium]